MYFQIISYAVGQAILWYNIKKGITKDAFCNTIFWIDR